ncbi:hypothetical protein L1887_56230 [Cichorium endivia]|nr:hypothetical protein L1887_56230 [Cichorium endivia]
MGARARCKSSSSTDRSRPATDTYAPPDLRVLSSIFEYACVEPARWETHWQERQWNERQSFKAAPRRAVGLWMRWSSKKGSGSDEPLERPSRTAPAGQPRHGLERFTAPSFTAPRKIPG